MAIDANLIQRGIQQGIQANQPITNLLQGVGTGQSLLQNRQNLGRGEIQNQILQQQLAQEPLRQELLQQGVTSGQNTLDTATADAGKAKLTESLATLSQVAKTLKPFIDAGDMIGAASQIDTLEKLGLPPEALKEIDDLISTGDFGAIQQQIATVESLNKANAGGGEIIKSSQRLVNIDGKQFSEVDVALPDGSLDTIRTPVGGDVARKTTGETIKEQRTAEVVKAGEEVLSKGEAEVKTPLGKIKLDEANAKNESDRQDIINAKNSRRVESDNAASVVGTLLSADFFSNAFGKIVTNTPDNLKSQDSLDAIAQLDQVRGLLSLESRQKLKGQGTITDSEAKTLEKSATILSNPLISDDLARKELRRVRNIFEASSDRNQLTKETKESETVAPTRIKFDAQGNII